MDNGACSYRRFLEGDDAGFVEIIRDYKDGLTLYLNGFAKNMDTAEEWMEDTFFKLVVKKPKFSGVVRLKHGCTPLGATWRLITSGMPQNIRPYRFKRGSIARATKKAWKRPI